MRNDDYRDVPLTLAVALALWAAAVAAGTQAGVFVRLGAGPYAALVAFAALFSAGTALVDERVRGWFGLRGGLAARLAALAIAALAVAAAIGASGAGAIDPAVGPWAPLLLFGVPVTLALGVLAVAPPGGRAAGAQGAATPRASTAPASRRGELSATRTSVASRAAAPARAGG